MFKYRQFFPQKMSSQQQVVEANPVEQPTSLVLDDLAFYELGAMGRAIVGLPNPDLSMFLPHHREDIFNSAAHYLEEILSRDQRDVQSAFAPYVAPILKGLEGTPLYEYQEHNLLQRINDPRARINVLMSLGKQDEARKVAQGSTESNGVLYGLKTIIENHELAEKRSLSTDEVQAISEKYLLTKLGFSRISQILEVYKEREIEATFRREPTIVDAILHDANQELGILAQDRDEKRGGEAFASFDATFGNVISGLVTERAGYISLARQCLNRNWIYAASSLSKMYLAQYDPEKDAQSRGDLEALAKDLSAKGNTYRGKSITDILAIPFDYEVTYANFLREATPTKELRELVRTMGPFGPLNTAQALLEAEDATLRKFAADSADLVHREHATLMETPERYANSLWYSVYAFAIAANQKIGNVEQIQSLESKLNEINGRVDEWRDSRSSRPEVQPVSKVSTQPNKPKNLGEMLLSDDAYVQAAWQAYETNGLFGIRKLTQELVRSRYKADEIGRAYGTHPIEILTALIEKRGLKLDNFPRDSPDLKHPDVVKARQAIVEYQFATGEMSMGIGAQAFHDFEYGEVNIPNPERFAMGIVTGIPGDTPFEASQILRNAERFQQLNSDARIPEVLYRAAAAEALKHYAEQRWRDIVTGTDRRPSEWYSALEAYKKLGNTGLAQFVERNFAQPR